MSEAEAIAALTDIGATFSAFVGLWVSVTFAYLTVAYFVGTKLSRFQCFAISTLYIVSATVFGASAQGYAESWHRLKDRTETVFSDVLVFSDTSFYGMAAAVFFLGGTVLSVYFMFELRNRHSRDAA